MAVSGKCTLVIQGSQCDLRCLLSNRMQQKRCRCFGESDERFHEVSVVFFVPTCSNSADGDHFVKLPTNGA